MSKTARNILVKNGCHCLEKNGCHCWLVQQCVRGAFRLALREKPAVAPEWSGTCLSRRAVGPGRVGACTRAKRRGRQNAWVQAPTLLLQRYVSTTAAVCCLALWGAVVAAAFGQSPDELGEVASWKRPSAEQVRSRVVKWLDGRDADDKIRDEVNRIWLKDPKENSEATAGELLDRAVRSFAVADGKARRLVGQCSGPAAGSVLPDTDWLADAQTDSFVAGNLRLLYGRWLANQSLLDEAREQLADLKPEDVVDPATLLFYQAVVYQGLLEREAGLGAVKRLLERADEGPRRYAEIGRLLKRDLETIEEDSLDHIARRMNDVGRRLELGRAGHDVRKIEDGVIESLDKLIEKVKKQQQQQQQDESGRDARNMQPSKPAEDSWSAGGKGPGEVTKKDIGDKADWGDLPPKQRQEALQQIGREFPAHYRDAIEQYFRKMAKED